MKCFQHQASEAVGVCVWCGRALCVECLHVPAPARVICSADCAAALARQGELLNQLAGISRELLRKSVQSAKASAFYCYLCAGLSAGGAVAAWFWLPVPFLIYFAGGCAVVLGLSGVWYQRGAGKRDAPSDL